MPMYRFVEPSLRSSTSIKYIKQQRGDQWWYKREVYITHPGAYDESHFQWFGPYDSEIECEMRMTAQQ